MGDNEEPLVNIGPGVALLLTDGDNDELLNCSAFELLSSLPAVHIQPLTLLVSRI